MFSGNLHILFLYIIWPFFSFHGKYTRNKGKKTQRKFESCLVLFSLFYCWWRTQCSLRDLSESIVSISIWCEKTFFFFTFSFISQKFARGHWKFVMEFLKIFFYVFSKYTYTQWNFKSVEKKKMNEIEGKKWKYFILV
jgi:hypothetical protein